MGYSTTKYVFHYDDILKEDMNNCNINDIRNAQFLFVDDFYVTDGDFVKKNDPILKVSCDLLDRNKFFVLRAIQDGYIDFYIHENDDKEIPSIILQDMELYFLYENEIVKFYSVPEIKIDKFTKNKCITWLLVGGINRYSTPANSIHVLMENEGNLHFSIEHHDQTNYIIFKYYRNQISLSNPFLIIFLLDNDEKINFVVENKINNNGLTILQCKISQNHFMELIKNKLIGIRIQSKDSINKIDSVGFDPWYNGNIDSVLKIYIAAFLNAIEEEEITIFEEDDTTNYSDDKCYVYLMHDLTNGFCKIGISNNPIYREGTLQSEKPTIELLAKKQFPNRKIAKSIEKSLHEAYGEYRVRGEWFELSDNDLDAIRKTLSN